MGNDVVDLREPRSPGQSEKSGFLHRVFTDAETAWIRKGAVGADRDRRLWILWAAKETAFKVISKILGSPPVFIHRAFISEPGVGDAPWGRVTWAAVTVSTRT